jgi:putative heme transporter
VPGGLGVVDAALILGLVASGLTSSSAVAAVVLYRLISFGFIIGAGWLIWLVIRYRTRNRPSPA